jgi:hypothetical protein
LKTLAFLRFSSEFGAPDRDKPVSASRNPPDRRTPRPPEMADSAHPSALPRWGPASAAGPRVTSPAAEPTSSAAARPETPPQARPAIGDGACDATHWKAAQSTFGVSFRSCPSSEPSVDEPRLLAGWPGDREAVRFGLPNGRRPFGLFPTSTVLDRIARGDFQSAVAKKTMARSSS